MSNDIFNDLDAYHYRDHSKPQYGRAQELITRHNFDESANVLDVGCGDGKITAEIASWIPKGNVIGVDASSNMIELARESFPRSEFPNLDFHCVKAEEIHFGKLFDKIICFSCLLWVRDAKKAIDSMCKLLVPGGELVILTYLKESSYVDFLEKTLESYPQYQKLSAAHTMFTAEEYRAALNYNKIKLIDFEVRDLISSFEGKIELRNYVKGWLGSYVPLPEDVQDSFLDQTVENSLYFAVSYDNNIIKLPYKSLVIRAVKCSD